MRIVFSLFFVLLLTCCTYSNGCRSVFQTVNCDGMPFPAIARVQYKHTIGHTDSEKRWKDAMKCGLKQGDVDLDSVMYKKGESYFNFELFNKFENCMAQLEYIIVKGCGRMNSVSDKKLCNM